MDAVGGPHTSAAPQQSQPPPPDSLPARLARLDDCEKQVIDALKAASQFMLDMSKDKAPTKSAIEASTTIVRTNMAQVEKELGLQIDYLAHVTTAAPHQGSSFLHAYEQDLQVQRAQNIDSQMRMWQRQRENIGNVEGEEEMNQNTEQGNGTGLTGNE